MAISYGFWIFVGAALALVPLSRLIARSLTRLLGRTCRVVPGRVTGSVRGRWIGLARRGGQTRPVRDGVTGEYVNTVTFPGRHGSTVSIRLREEHPRTVGHTVAVYLGFLYPLSRAHLEPPALWKAVYLVLMATAVTVACILF